jgi:hypothetical protein
MLVYVVAIWFNLRQLGLFYGNLVYVHMLLPLGILLWLFGILFPFWYIEPIKIWQPLCPTYVPASESGISNETLIFK